MLGAIDFVTDWSTLWGDLAPSQGLLTDLGIIGVIVLVASLVGWVLERRRSGFGGGMRAHSGLLWTMLFGALLAAPNVLIPALLTLIDLIINPIVNVL